MNTLFPDQIDEVLFFQDMRIRNLPTYKEYIELYKKKKYVEASECLQDSDTYYYGAYLLNRVNDQLRAIENYMLNDFKKAERVNYDTEPEEYDYRTTWID